MKDKNLIKIILIIISVLSLFIYTKTEATTTCTTKEKNNLIQLAHNVKISYELMPDEGSLNRSFSLILSNMVEDIEVRYGFSTYSYDKNSTNPGVIKMSEYFAGGKTHKILIYSSSSSVCKNKVLATKMVALPKYNTYSEREECVGIEDFKLCQRWYSGAITEQEFQKQTKSYRESLKSKKPTEETNTKESTIIDNFIDMYQQNLIVSNSIIVLLLMLFTMLIVRKIIKDKKRKKINL